MMKINLQRVGINYNGYTAYKDEDGNFYFDLSLSPQSNPMMLYCASPSKDMDGEAGFELKRDFVITNPYTERELREYHCKGKYMMLSRVYNDLVAYLGKTGNEEIDKRDFRYQNDRYGLWGDDVAETIEEIKRRWEEIPEDLRPEWCTAEDIAELERKAMATN